jgi:signal transduction histidine kinase
MPRAKAITIGRRKERGRLILSIADDGKGLSKAMKTGIGMRSMQTRSQMMGATLDLRSKRGRARKVVCSAPFNE